MPEPETRVCGAFAHRRSQTGVLAAMMALDSGESLCPKPSRIINTTGLGVAVIRLDSLYERGKGVHCRATAGMLPPVYLAGCSVSCTPEVLPPDRAVYTGGLQRFRNYTSCSFYNTLSSS